MRIGGRSHDPISYQNAAFRGFEIAIVQDLDRHNPPRCC